MNAKNCIEKAADLEYIREVFEVRYKIKTDDLTKPKGENKVLAEDQVEIY